MTSSWSLLCVAVLTLLAMTAAAPLGEIVDPEDPEVQACLSFALESLRFHDDEHQYSMHRVVSVRMEPIGGGQYDMDVEVKKTGLCGPGRDSCDPAPGNEQILQCNFVVLTAPWKQQRVLIKKSCSESQS